MQDKLGKKINYCRYNKDTQSVVFKDGMLNAIFIDDSNRLIYNVLEVYETEGGTEKTYYQIDPKCVGADEEFRQQYENYLKKLEELRDKVELKNREAIEDVNKQIDILTNEVMGDKVETCY